MAPPATQCPECDRMVIDGSEHTENCYFRGSTAESLEEKKRSWRQESRYEAYKGI